ncbi:MAG: hypothetical protein HKP25_06835 [Marinicaulis sp.]|nr:hypothetical protein [Marinicaulis sp.]
MYPVNRPFAIFAVLILLIWGVSIGANAQSTAEREYTTTTLLSEKSGIEPGGTTWLAFHQNVRDNWHVFWKNPGDAGLPLALEWELPPGFEPGEVVFPAPEFIPVGPLASYAHEGEPVFLAPLTAPEEAIVGETIDIKVKALWQACEEICVPEDAAFSISLPVLERATPRYDLAPLFRAARKATPPIADYPAKFSAGQNGDYELVIDNWSASTENIFFFPEQEGLTKPAAAQRAVLDGDRLTIRMQPGWVEHVEAGVLPGVLRFGGDDEQHIAISAKVDRPIAKPRPLTAAATVSERGLGLLLAMAFFGGVILNAMPCVFPILFVKAANILNSASENNGEIRQHGLLYGAGVLATFLLIGGALLILRAGGAQLGWGFHLQSPMVVGLSAYILLLVGLNLFGVFHVGASIAGAGQGLTQKGGATGAFFTGALAVVVAAPCIGPLLSAPMGAALLRPPVIGILIFAVLAIGFAAPYVLLSFYPALGKRMPKPGAWMATFKQALAFPVFAAAAYFLWVFARQTGDGALGVLLSGALFISLGAWLFEQSKGDGRAAFAARIAAAFAVVAAVAPLTRIEASADTGVEKPGAYGAISPEIYDPELLDAFRASGTPVFVDFTAAWCVTCQFNKMTVLKTKEISDAFRETGTVLMVADWTVRDPEITAALESFGASGVPLYVFYDASGAPEVLPQTLSKKIVVNALKRN